MRPLVGITPCLDDRGRWRAGREYLYADLAYARAVENAGGLPVVLPVHGAPEALIERIDALLLPGGDDFLPDGPYPADVVFDATPERQLDFDGRLIEAATLRSIPVLGICYGMQRLVLTRGGSLYYDLPTDLPEASCHKPASGDGRHAIAIEPGSLLAAALGSPPASVNTLHHQAVRDPGTGLRVSARADDGVVEAVESEHGFCIGVQWHPEREDDDASRALFRAFVDAAHSGD